MALVFAQTYYVRPRCLACSRVLSSEEQQYLVCVQARGGE